MRLSPVAEPGQVQIGAHFAQIPDLQLKQILSQPAFSASLLSAST